MPDNRRDLPRTRRAKASPYPETGLAELGLAPGDVVRFRRTDDERWKEATVERRERDGSVGIRDAKGAARAIPIERLQVKGTGKRGGVVWEALADKIARSEQLRLL